MTREPPFQSSTRVQGPLNHRIQLSRTAPKHVGSHATLCNRYAKHEVTADGVDEVLRGVREQLMLGASQIKVMAGGGVCDLEAGTGTSVGCCSM